MLTSTLFSNVLKIYVIHTIQSKSMAKLQVMHNPIFKTNLIVWVKTVVGHLNVASRHMLVFLILPLVKIVHIFRYAILVLEKFVGFLHSPE